MVCRKEWCFDEPRLKPGKILMSFMRCMDSLAKPLMDGRSGDGLIFNLVVRNFWFLTYFHSEHDCNRVVNHSCLHVVSTCLSKLSAFYIPVFWDLS